MATDSIRGMELGSRIRITIHHSAVELVLGIILILISVVGFANPRIIPLPQEVDAAVIGFGLALLYDAYSKADLRATLARLQGALDGTSSGVSDLLGAESKNEARREAVSLWLGARLADWIDDRTTGKVSEAGERMGGLGSTSYVLGIAELLDGREYIKKQLDEFEINPLGPKSGGSPDQVRTAQVGLLSSVGLYIGRKHGSRAENAFGAGAALARTAVRLQRNENLEENYWWYPNLDESLQGWGVPPEMLGLMGRVMECPVQEDHDLRLDFLRILGRGLVGYCGYHGTSLADEYEEWVFKNLLSMAGRTDVCAEQFAMDLHRLYAFGGDAEFPRPRMSRETYPVL